MVTIEEIDLYFVVCENIINIALISASDINRVGDICTIGDIELQELKVSREIGSRDIKSLIERAKCVNKGIIIIDIWIKWRNGERVILASYERDWQFFLGSVVV